MESCRLCLWKGGDENKIISVLNSQDTELPTKIKNCVSIEITLTDQLPKMVCIVCMQKVNDWYSFKEMCIRSNELLQLSFPNIEKTTPPVEENKENELACKSEEKELSDDEGDVFDSKDDDDWKLESLSDQDVYGFDNDDFYGDENVEFHENIYKCDICSKEFDDCMEYLDHQNTHDGEPVFKCDMCSEVFSSRKDLVSHDKTHKKPCQKCGKMIMKSSMKLHLIQHTDKYMCTKCSHRFCSKATLKQHIITVHTNIKDHICESCGKRFSSKTAMNVHLKSHSEERLYSCKLCDYAGRTSSAIYIHMATHANEVHYCEMCPKSFKSLRNLKDHRRRVHTKNKKHICNYCQKKFVDKYMLTVHLRCHTGVRPFKCKLCDKAFIRSDSLKEHMVTHGERTMYNCNQCLKKFTSKRGAARHHCPTML